VLAKTLPRFVLEIGTEEIPPRFFPPVLAQLREDGAGVLERARLTYGELKVYGTPRRLVLIAEELAEKQLAARREERGPAARVAFDEEGKTTKAAEGFARRHGLAAEDLEVKETEQGEYVFAVIQEPELAAKDALAGLLPDLIAGLSFPKSMRWGSGKLRFGRPARWLLALVDHDVVEFGLEALRSGREARGHPVLADGMFPVAHAGEYERALGERSVIVDPQERKNVIREQIGEIERAEKANVVDGGLLEETSFLVEWPTAGCGQFDPSFLRLPRAVLIEEMQHVQSYFPLADGRGELLPKFIAVRDGGGEHLGVVLRGWEGVLRAKLIDASYFYEQDLRTPLEGRVSDLRGVVFQERLGTMHDKAERVRATAAEAARQAGLETDEAAALDRAALLCKADLTTQMVAELSGLQGMMGREYARASGEPAAVAEAIGEHYRPRFAGDDIPATTAGRLLAVADKLDTVAAYFSIGAMPTGSADPYGLRRAAIGIIAILTSPQAPVLSLLRLLDVELGALYGQVDVGREREGVAQDVQGFLQQRLAVYLRDAGVRHDLVDAALAVGIDDIARAEKRAQALRLLADRDDFLPTVIACTRPINIAEGFEGGKVDPDLLREEAEKALWDAHRKVAAEADSIDLVKLFELFSRQLRAPIDRYFEEVLVMAEEEALRQNRLAMCWDLTQLFRRLADLSMVVQA
jgi:glycyl-tRNA synthetase beta chain